MWSYDFPAAPPVVLAVPITSTGRTDLALATLYVRVVSTAELSVPGMTLAPSDGRRRRDAFAAAAWVLVGALPLVGLVSLVLREQLDPNWSNPQVHFTVFLTVGIGV